LRPFRDTHPDYAEYDDTTYVMKSVPDGLVSGLAGILLRYSGEPGIGLKHIVNTLLSFVPEAPTQNWGREFLVQDLDYAFRQLSAAKFYRFMDGIAMVVEYVSNEIGTVIDEVNELANDHDFGYAIKRNSQGDCFWVLRAKVRRVAAPVRTATRLVGDVCQQTLAHLEQVKAQLERGTPRARKDALRDVMSAMESLLRNITGADDIVAATKILRESSQWGPDAVVKEGVSLWNRLHDLHPDVRHGNPTVTELPVDEALFWIECITVFINYIARRERSRRS
jgi:hypothetical protein